MTIQAVKALALDVDVLHAEVIALGQADEPPDLGDVVKALIHIRAVMEQFRDARDLLAEIGASLMPQRILVIEGVGAIEKTGGWNRSQWEHDRLASHVVRFAQQDREDYARDHDGEVPESEGAAVARLLLDSIGVSYWKVTGFRERGIEADDYCTKVKARSGIRLPKAQ